METTENDIARIVADADQLAELMARFAKATTNYFCGLMQGGMTRDEAMALTTQWHEIWLMANMTIESDEGR